MLKDSQRSGTKEYCIWKGMAINPFPPMLWQSCARAILLANFITTFEDRPLNSPPKKA